MTRVGNGALERISHFCFLPPAKSSMFLRMHTVLIKKIVRSSCDSCFCAHQVVITVLAETSALSQISTSLSEDEDAAQPRLIFNLYCPKLCEGVDVDLPHAMQKVMTGEMCRGYVHSFFLTWYVYNVIAA